MLVRLLKANLFYNIILVPIVGALFLLKSFQPELPFAGIGCENGSPICNWLISLELSNKQAILINFGAITFINFLLLLINAKFAFLKERTFLPPYLFMIIVLAFPSLHTIQPAFVAAIFIMLALQRIFATFEKNNAISNAFDASFLTGFAAIFYLPALVMTIAIPFSLFVLKSKLSGREFFASFFGCILLWIFYFSYFFITNQTSNFFDLFVNAIEFSDRSLFLKIPVLIYFTLLLIITFAASIFILKQYGIQKISTRRYFKILAYYFINAAVLIAIPMVSIEILILLTLPLTFLLSNYLIFMRRRFWAESILIGLILFSIAMQFVLK